MLAEISPLTTYSLAAGAVLGLWLFFFGACIGSFLNVVAYRLPLKKTLVWQPSKCPKCNAAIRPWHNVPVLGWLMLRGRCRDCKAPISPRYPLVEAAAGGMLLALGWVELIGGGRNLPQYIEQWPVGPAAFISALPWPLIALFAYHAWLMYVLLAAALIRFDGLAVPRSLAVCGVVVGLGASFYGVLHPLPWQGLGGASLDLSTSTALTSHAIMQGLATAMVGLALGTLLGRPMTRWLAGKRYDAYSDGPFLLALLGVYLGWQTVALLAVLVFVLALVLGTGAKSQGKRGGSLSAASLAMTLVVLLTWRQWNEWAFASPWVPAALAIGFMLLAPVAIGRGWLAPRE